MEFTFDVWDKIKQGWKLYKENWAQIILFIVVLIVIQMIMNSMFMGMMMKGTISTGAIFSFIVYYIISIVVSAGISFVGMKAGLQAIDGRGFRPFSGDILNFSGFWNYLKTSILFGLIIFGGVLLFGIMGGFLSVISPVIHMIMAIVMIILLIVLTLRLFPAMYLSIDKNQGARQNIKEAWAITENCATTIFVSILLIGLFMIAGIIALGVGLLITYPIGMFVIVMLYRELYKFRYGVVNQVPEIPLIKDIGEAPVNTEVITEAPEEIKS